MKHKDALQEKLDQKIDETLDHYHMGLDTISDGYNILRWASRGLLTRKFKDETS